MTKVLQKHEYATLYDHYFNKEIIITLKNTSELNSMYGVKITGTLKARILGEFPHEQKKRPTIIAIVIKESGKDRYILMRNIESIESMV